MEMLSNAVHGGMGIRQNAIQLRRWFPRRSHKSWTCNGASYVHAKGNSQAVYFDQAALMDLSAKLGMWLYVTEATLSTSELFRLGTISP